MARSTVRRVRALAVAAATLALPPTVLSGRGAATTPAPATPPDVLLVVIDTLRPDALGWAGARHPTPHLDRLAAEGLRFPRAVSPVPLTLPAHVSLFTGLVPRRHGVRDNGQVLSPRVPLLAEALRRQGYATAAFVSGYPLRAVFGLDRGFEHYDDTLPVRAGSWSDRSAAQTVAAALAYLRAARAPSGASSRPQFLFVHFYDPHDPYEPPQRLRRPGPRGAYDGEVAAVDEAVGELWNGLTDLGLTRRLLTVITADHGESLGEHGEPTHGFFIYAATTQVPLVLHQPGRVRPGLRHDPVRLVDLAPTLLDLVGAPRFPGVDGVSLRPLTEGRSGRVEAAYSESVQPWLGYGWAPLRALQAGTLKLIAAPRPELYDLERDPGETRNLLPGRAADAERLRGLLRTVEARSTVAAAGGADSEALETLRSLGYVGGGGSPALDAPSGLPDPKDRLALKDRLDAAEGLLSRGQAAAALKAFDAVLAAEPGSRFALLRSGTALLRLRRPREAAARLEQVVALDPGQAEARYALAEAWSAAGDRRALPGWMEVVRLQPRRAVAWSNLGALLMQAGDAAGAVRALERAAGLDPGDPLLLENLAEARFSLALAESRAGRADAARTLLRQALAADPRLRQRALTEPLLAPLLP